MGVILLRGDVGNGKSLFATALSLEDEEERPIWSNFEIKSKRYHPLELTDLNKKIKGAAIVIIDEAYGSADARYSGKASNQYLSYIVMQMRKRELDIIVIAQLDGMLDKRLRMMASWVVDCEIGDAGFSYVISFPKKALARPIGFFMPLEIAQEYFPKYNTMEIINAIDEDLEFKLVNKATLLPEIDRVVGEMMKVAPPEQWTQGTVEAYFLDNHLPHAEAKLAYQRIKLRMIQKGKVKKNGNDRSAGEDD